MAHSTRHVPHEVFEGSRAHIDLTRHFLPEALTGAPQSRALDLPDSVRLNQIRSASYLHMFDVLESVLGKGARVRAGNDEDVHEQLQPILRLDAFDHASLFRTFLDDFGRAFPVPHRRLPWPKDLEAAVEHAAPHALLVLALHLKLVTQQHYLACVRGDEALEPAFVRLLKDHWNLECGGDRPCGAVVAIQTMLTKALPGRIPSALRDYKLLVFAIDDVLKRQAELDVATLEDARGAPLPAPLRKAAFDMEVAAHRKTFLTVGIVNAAFVYAMRSLGPAAPSMLAGVVAALSTRT
jgi:hypothetical protein